MRLRNHPTREGPVKDFKQLKVWQKSHQLTLALYQVTATFPREEAYGLTAQIRRSAYSIPSNFGRGLRPRRRR